MLKIDFTPGCECNSFGEIVFARAASKPVSDGTIWTCYQIS